MPIFNDVFLPVTFNHMNLWPGHAPATRGCLGAILDEAALRPGGLSLAERALLMACEFWSAVATQSLVCHLGAIPEQRLDSLASVFRAMGAKRAARAMQSTVQELARISGGWQRERRIAALETAMVKLRVVVDESLSRFAYRLHKPLSVPLARRAAAVLAPAAPRRIVAIVPRRPLPTLGAKPDLRPVVRWRSEIHSAARQD